MAMAVLSSAGLCALGPRFITTRHVYLSTARWIVASSNGQRRPVLKNDCCRFSDQLTAFRSTSQSSNLTCRAIDDAEETRPVRCQSDRGIVPRHGTWVVPEKHTWQALVNNFSHPMLSHHRLLFSASFSQGSGARRRVSHPEQRSGYGDLKSTGFGQQEPSDLSGFGIYPGNRQIGPGWWTESREKQTGGAGLGGGCRELCMSHVARGISISPPGGGGRVGGGRGAVRGCRSNSVAGGGSEALATAMADKEETNGEGVCSSSPAMGASVTESIRSTDGGIVLTELEETIFKAMVETSKRFGLKTKLRVAGGWVRDKLLGKESSDIDIALDDMLGRDFAEKFNEYLISIGVETSSIVIIQRNHARSKHLETATTRVHGVRIDFANLRSEKYAENSRFPTVEFGSAEEDALRRDLTINSLFYNINTGCVEDFTGRGLDDLRMGIIRTPLDPLSTFRDDSLRVLRAIRLGARLGFRLDDQLAAAAASEEVRTDLGSKISRERIGIEVDSMMKGQDPLTAVKNISRLGLFSTVFELPHDLQPPVAFNYGSACVASLESVLQLLEHWPQESFTKNDEWLCLLGGLLMPLRNVTIVRKKRNVPVTMVMIRESLKLQSKDAQSVGLIHSFFRKIQELATLHSFSGKIQELVTLLVDPGADQSLPDSMPSRPSDQIDDVSLHGLVLTIKELWRPTLVLSAMLDNPVVNPLGREPPDCRSIAFAIDESSNKEKLDVRYKSFVDRLAEAQAAWPGNLTPIFGSVTPASFLKLLGPGPTTPL